MRTMTGNSPRAAFCVFLLLLCAAVKSPATETVEARKRVNEDLSTYAGADLSQSVPTDQTIGPEASITTPPDSSHRLAELISRIRSNASLSHSDEERGPGSGDERRGQRSARTPKPYRAAPFREIRG